MTRHSWMQIARTNYLNQSSCLLLTFFNQLYHPSIKSLSTLYSYGDYKCWNHCKRKRNFYLSPWWISEFVLLSPLRVFITTSNYNNHFICFILIEAVIILCVILMIFLKKQQIASNILCSLILSVFRRWEQK